MRNDLFFEFVNGSRCGLRLKPPLQIAIQIFIGIAFRGVRRQIEDLDLLLMFLKPVLHGVTMMHFQIIQNQKDFVGDIRDQPLHEEDQSGCIHCLVIQHKADLPLIGHRRNHIQANPLPSRPFDNRGFPNGGVAALRPRLFVMVDCDANA